MKTRWLIGVGSILLLLGTPQVWADDRITAFVNREGKIVFTNLADYTPASADYSAAATETTAVTPTPNPSTTVTPSRTVGTLDGLIDTISTRHRVDPSLVRAVIQVESNFDRRAVSHKGARGLMQLIPATGKRFGVRDFFDPAQNIEGGVRYLRLLLDMFPGRLDLSLAAYNSGENRVARLGRIPRIPETQNYVRKVQAAYRKIHAQARSAAPVAPKPRPVVSEPVSQIAKEEAAKPPAPALYRTVDDRGVSHFSNVGPKR
jgi:soluble lytic murein transglycosylase-like protein